MSADDETPDLGLHAVADEPTPITPDHDASKDPGLVERVKERARTRGASSQTRDSVKTPPRKSAKRAMPSVSQSALKRSLAELYASLGMIMLPFDPVCAQVILDSADKCADSLAALAQTNDAIKRVLIALTQTSAWGGVMIAHAPLMLAVLAHHGPDDVKARVAPVAILLNGMPTQPPAPEAAAS